LRGLQAQRLGHALHFGGVVGWVLAVLPIPGCREAATGLREGGVGRGGGLARVMKRLRQIGYLGWATGLQAVVDRPGIAARIDDEPRDAYELELHRTVPL
jgi:hypothetical protein